MVLVPNFLHRTAFLSLFSVSCEQGPSLFRQKQRAWHTPHTGTEQFSCSCPSVLPPESGFHWVHRPPQRSLWLRSPRWALLADNQSHFEDTGCPQSDTKRAVCELRVREPSVQGEGGSVAFPGFLGRGLASCSQQLWFCSLVPILARGWPTLPSGLLSCTAVCPTGLSLPQELSKEEKVFLTFHLGFENLPPLMHRLDHLKTPSILRMNPQCQQHLLS